eukprot:scaffold1462_cov260-Pinguiococcus_pyrenoidosus.AAC.3
MATGLASRPTAQQIQSRPFGGSCGREDMAGQDLGVTGKASTRDSGCNALCSGGTRNTDWCNGLWFRQPEHKRPIMDRGAFGDWLHRGNRKWTPGEDLKRQECLLHVRLIY